MAQCGKRLLLPWRVTNRLQTHPWDRYTSIHTPKHSGRNLKPRIIHVHRNTYETHKSHFHQRGGGGGTGARLWKVWWWLSAHLVNLSDPAVDAVKRPAIGDVIHQQDALGTVNKQQRIVQALPLGSALLFHKYGTHADNGCAPPLSRHFAQIPEDRNSPPGNTPTAIQSLS